MPHNKGDARSPSRRLTPFLPPFAVFIFTRPLFFPDDLGNALYQTDGAVIIIYVDVSGHDDFVPLERRLDFGVSRQ